MLLTSQRLRASMLAILMLPFMTSCGQALTETKDPQAQEAENFSAENFSEDDEAVLSKAEYAASEDRTLENLVVEMGDVTASADILEKYKHLDPKKLVPRNLLKKALLYWEANPSRFPNKKFIAVVDFSKKSRKDRFFLIDMKTGSVLDHHVAHGSKSDKNDDGIPETFSNIVDSNMSSLGVYRASESYQSDKFGYSMRLDGLSSTNSNVRKRAIVLHPAWYVKETSLYAPGKTYGCLGLSSSVSEDVINKMKGGSLIYVGLSAKE